ncbi:hypothetical protein X798_00988 [Onchocerca flexuosa]|uniref:Uncharacterized protein n=1 Tax=Onchocerca flexuosa TaxID=387005 RepID=A0A238C2W8_9BILA|nr:hypothetical protein X798_00988 [Onchocerca flexuosa]
MDVTQTLNEEHNAVVEMIDKTAVPMGRYPNIYKSPQQCCAYYLWKLRVSELVFKLNMTSISSTLNVNAMYHR